MLILNAIDNGLACDCGVSRVLNMTCHRFCKKYFPWKWFVLIVYFIIYKVMKYRKILIKYNAYFKTAVFHSGENIKSCISQPLKYKLYFTGEIGFPLFSPWLPWSHFRISNASYFFISGQKHKVLVFIFLVRPQGKFWYLIFPDLLSFSFSLSLLLLLWFQFWRHWSLCNIIINIR